MIFKNLARRKGRTILTVVGIGVGAAAIVALGAVAEGMRAGYTEMAQGSRADLILTQAGALDVTMGSVDETVAGQLRAWPEVADVDGMLIGNVQAEESAYFFLFGYDPQGFAIAHFRIVEGQALRDVRGLRGKPLILGREAAESQHKAVGDTFHVTGGVFRIVGIYETGDAFEESGAVIPLQEAQNLLLQPHRVSLLYVRLRDPAGEARLRARVERSLPDLALSTTSEFANRQQMISLVEGIAWGVAALAVLVGGVGMTNTLFMSVLERTREIGLLRATGWRRGQVLRLILGESLALSWLGGLAGIGLGIVAALLVSGSLSYVGALGVRFSPGLFARALGTVVVLGLVGGAYPAWWASRLLPLEALQYEGGTASRTRGQGRGIRRFLASLGMTAPWSPIRNPHPRVLTGAIRTPVYSRAQSAIRNLPSSLRSLWRRRTRTALTLLGTGVGIAAIVALGGITRGMLAMFTAMLTGSQADLMAIQADTSDAYYSVIDERVGARIAARPDVESVAGMIYVVAGTEKMPLLMGFGYHPREFGIRRFRIVAGQPLAARRQVIVGRQAAQKMGLEVGDTLRLLESNFRVVGFYETGVPYEDNGVVIGLQEGQALSGKPHQVMIYLIKVRDPRQAAGIQDELKVAFPDLDVSLASNVAESMPEMQRMDQYVGAISLLAVFVGGVGMLNTMLMSVLERTREIGVLRALGWRQRRVLGMVLREALLLGVVGGACGILLGVGLAWIASQIPGSAGAIDPHYEVDLFVRALVVASVTGAIGGLYPAWRATRMRPVEALRYE